MDLDGLGVALLVGSVIVLLAVVGVRVVSRMGLPGLLLYLVLGLVIGETVPSLNFDDPTLATVLGYAALVVILAEGGLTTEVEDLRPVLAPAVVLATVGVAVSIGVVALPLVFWVGLDTRTAILIGAVLAATDAAAVFSVLRRLRLHPGMRSLLEAEAGFNDAPVVVLVVVLSSSVGHDVTPWQIPLIVLLELLGGAVVGVLIGLAGRSVMPRLALPAAGLYPLAVMAMLIGAYGAASVVHTSGFLATYVAGVLIGSTPALPHRRSVVGFAEGLAWAAQIGLFVMLGLLADPQRALGSMGVAVVAGVTLVVAARPLGAIIALTPFRFPWRWIAFVSGAGLRGAVPIVFAAIPLGLGVPGSEVVFDATLILVIVLTLLQTPTLPWIARHTGVATALGGHELTVESAPLDTMDAQLLGFDIPRRSRLAGLYVADLRLPEGAVVSLVVRSDHGIVPDGDTRLRAGDQLMVVVTQDAHQATLRRLHAVSQHGRLAGWGRG